MPSHKFLNAASTNVQLFLSSYAIFFALLAVKWWSSTAPTLSYVCGGVALLGVAMTWRLWRSAQTLAREEIMVETVEDKGADVAGYILTYILPFLTSSTPGTQDLLSYGLFLSVVVIIYMQSGLVFINPLLYLLRYRLFAVTVADQECYLISKDRPRLGSTVEAARVLSNVYFAY